MNTRVSGIEYTSEGVKVKSGEETFEAGYAIVTAPLGVLKSGDITFSPKLPAEKAAAICTAKMGSVNKFLLVWDDAFWDTETEFIGYTPETKGKFNFFMNMRAYTPDNALMTFAFGKYSDTTEQMSDREITGEIMNHLRSIFGSDIPEPKRMLRTAWAQNRNTYGAYSFAPVGTDTSFFDTLAEPVGKRLLFAGEHTSRQFRGTVHGAYLSGIRQAEKIRVASNS